MKPLIQEDEIQTGVQRVAEEISSHFVGRSLTILGIMSGSVVFVADLIRLLDIPIRVGFIFAKSYRGTDVTPGELTLNADFLPDISGKHVLLVDDIFDTGQTLHAMHKLVSGMQPASIRSAVLLRKSGRRKAAIEPDHVGFDIPDEFVIGYGLDHNDYYRNLRYIAVLEAGDAAREPTE